MKVSPSQMKVIIIEEKVLELIKTWNLKNVSEEQLSFLNTLYSTTPLARIEILILGLLVYCQDIKLHIN